MKFKNVTHYGDPQLSEVLELSLVSWLQWAFLEVGGFTTVARGQTAPFGGEPAKLRLGRDPQFALGRAWHGVRHDWVWESGLSYEHQPVPISGAYVNGTFSSPSGAYPHRVLYPDGSVLFDTPLPTGAAVECEYSYRHVQVRPAPQGFFEALQFNSLRPDDPQFVSPDASGAWDAYPRNRLQMPAVVVEVAGRGDSTPYELGNTARARRKTALLHVFAETDWEAKHVADLLERQEDLRLPGLDKGTMAFPLNRDGSLAAGALTFPQLAAQYPWRSFDLLGASSTDQPPVTPGAYWRTVRTTWGVVLP